MRAWLPSGLLNKIKLSQGSGPQTKTLQKEVFVSRADILWSQNWSQKLNFVGYSMALKIANNL
jgi:hypothetical protein